MNRTRAAAAVPEGLRWNVVEVGDEVVLVLRFPARAAIGLPATRALSPAEKVVLDGLFEGKSNEEIARARGTSKRTVANQIASIFAKHAVSSRRELLALYLGDHA
ncbi:MAG: helix-turn-helix transcriptional regulator [Deltaproteobacteria bacterium]|nr:helix-turn-helix transcriptional regulator [Deltaproteobacteria bacterium]